MTKYAQRPTMLLSPQLKSRSVALYSLSSDGHSIRCNRCGHVSRNDTNVQKRFCPNCMSFHEDHALMRRLEEGLHVPLPSAQTWTWLREAA